jgi:hypothetical protein
MKTMPERNGQVEPLCKFGPGGNFAVAWRPEPPEVLDMSNRLVRLLGAALEVLAVIFGCKQTAAHVLWRDTAHGSEVIDFDREKARNAAENSRLSDTAHAPAIAVADTGGAFSGEQMLFPDLGGDGVRAKHKPKHRIRAYRRVAKKGAALGFGEQGTLFESQFKSAKTA